MALHDWTRVPSGLFHDFHQSWSVRIKDALNAGRMPKGYSALVEQRIGPMESDVLAIEHRSKSPRPSGNGGVLILAPPAARFVQRTSKDIYAYRANRVVIKHHLGDTVAVVEIVSPGNKDNKGHVREFVEKSIDYLREGVHVLIVDLFPPTKRDPQGMHKLIWDEITESDFTLPEGKDRVLASFEAGRAKTVYVEPIAVGDDLPDMPLFLFTGMHIQVPLESTYRETWQASPEEFRIAVETGVIPEPDAEE